MTSNTNSLPDIACAWGKCTCSLPTGDLVSMEECSPIAYFIPMPNKEGRPCLIASMAVGYSRGYNGFLCGKVNEHSCVVVLWRLI